MQKNYPSIKTIMQINGVDKSAARLVREIMRAESIEALQTSKNLEKIYEIYYNRIGIYMYNPHRLNELKMQLLNIVLGGYGVESFETLNNGYCDFINFGHTYQTTLVYFKGRLIVSSWGDIAEHYTTY